MNQTRKKHMKTYKSFNADMLERLKKLKDKGFNATEAAQIIGTISPGAAQVYYRILTAVHAGRMVDVVPKAYCEEAIKEYCSRHDLNYIPFTATPAHEEVTGNDEQLSGQMSLDDIVVTDGPEPISEQMMTPGRNEPEELLQLRQDMSRAIGRFVWRIIDEYMKRTGIVEEKK